jgi:hypothetical protein
MENINVKWDGAIFVSPGNAHKGSELQFVYLLLYKQYDGQD